MTPGQPRAADLVSRYMVLTKAIMPNLARTSRSYLFTTKRFPKTWPKASGPRRPTYDLLSEREQARLVTFKSVTGP